MGFRYRKRISLGGLGYINLSKQGLSSLSIGKPGAIINIGKKGVKGTVGLPGTGLSYSKTMHSSGRSSTPLGDDDFFDSSHSKRESYDAEERREELEKFLELNQEINFENAETFWSDIKKRPYIYDEVLDISEDKKDYIEDIIQALNLAASESDEEDDDEGDDEEFVIKDTLRPYTLGKYPPIISVSEIASSISNEQVQTLMQQNANNQRQKLLLFFGLSILSISLVFWVGNWFFTLVGLAMAYPVFKKLYESIKYYSAVAGKDISRNCKAVLVYKEMIKRKPIWKTELEEEKKLWQAEVEKLYQEAVSGNMSSLSEAVPQILSDVPERKDASVDVAVSDDGMLLINLDLPEAESLITTHQFTSTGKVSSIDKSGKQTNLEYATCVLNYAFLVLSRFFSAYPKVNNIKLAGFTERHNEVTGNLENTYILYMNSERAHFNNINFNNANVVSLAKHLGYTLDIDGRTGYMGSLEIKDKEMIRHITDEI